MPSTRSATFKLLQVVLSYPVLLLGTYPYLLESLPCTLEVMMYAKKLEISLLSSELLFSVPVLTQKQDNPNKVNVNITRWSRGVGYRPDYKSHPNIIHLGNYTACTATKLEWLELIFPLLTWMGKECRRKMIKIWGINTFFF